MVYTKQARLKLFHRWDKMELNEALEKALAFEKNGYELYGAAAESSSNPIVKKTFSYLAMQETNHIDEIKNFIETKNPDMKLLGDRMPEVKEFFKTSLLEFKEKLELSSDDIAAHEAGLHLEQSAYDFYKEELDAVTDEKTKEFFAFLMEQEKAHYTLIEKAYDYIKNPEGWYAEEEGWLLEG